jgi:DNA-binding IclR family transcriptional regulator
MKDGDRSSEAGIGGAQSIRRAMDVIRAVAQFQRSGANLRRVSQATDLRTSTAFRILRSLVEERMLRYDELNKDYYIGPLAFELGLATQTEAQISGAWREAIENVARQTRLTSYLMARSDCDAVCLLCIQGLSTIRAMPIDVGQRLPLGIGAGSLAILATLHDEEINQVIAENLTRLDLFPGGRSEAKKILLRVESARRMGYAFSSGSVAQGLTGIGVPILPRQGLVQLAISVSAAGRVIDAAEAKQVASIISSAIRERSS